MVVFPNAKINFGLRIINRRADGFHNIESIFIPVAWNDILEVVPNDLGHNTFVSSGLTIPGASKDNLCLKAHELISEDYDIPFVNIHLHKQIPIGAGLGGGSADGAFMLKTINELFELKINIRSLELYAGQLGSDCPFFIKNTPCYVTETGTKLEPLDFNLDNYHLLIINPGIHISTKEAYSGVSPYIPDSSLKVDCKHTSSWNESIKNDFEAHILKNYPLIEQLKSELVHQGAFYVSMTGSGSSIYALFESDEQISNFFHPNYEYQIIPQKRAISDLSH